MDQVRNTFDRERLLSKRDYIPLHEMTAEGDNEQEPTYHEVSGGFFGRICICITLPFVDSERIVFQQILCEWVESGAPWEKFGKSIAAKRITEASIGANILDLRNLQITSLPDIFGLLSFRTSLSILVLSKNRLNALPTSIGELENLQQLFLEDNFFTSIPAAIRNTQKISILSLSNNRLASLSLDIGSYYQLTHLTVSNNHIEELPDDFCDLVNLRVLDLSNNELQTLPPSIVKLENLSELDLTGNQLTSLLPEIGELPRLQQLSVGNNKLKTLPERIGKLALLIRLWVFNNQLEGLPAALGNLKRLHQLDVKNNPALQFLPAAMDRCFSLLFLDTDPSLKNAADVLLGKCKTARDQYQNNTNNNNNAV